MFITLLFLIISNFKMKTKKPVHPKLYIDKVEKNNIIELKYVQNSYNSSGKRIIESQIINDYKDINLIEENLKQLEILKNYIKIQKRVLEKHQKSRNYDAIKILKQSILHMQEFEDEINSWFEKNREII